ncbi:hypothetical protein BDR22DRAFT_827306 [Usnea florida]
MLPRFHRGTRILHRVENVASEFKAYHQRSRPAIIVLIESSRQSFLTDISLLDSPSIRAQRLNRDCASFNSVRSFKTCCQSHGFDDLERPSISLLACPARAGQLVSIFEIPAAGLHADLYRNVPRTFDHLSMQRGYLLPGLSRLRRCLRRTQVGDGRSVGRIEQSLKVRAQRLPAWVRPQSCLVPL